MKPPVAMVEVQGYYYHSYRCLAELALDVFKDKTMAEKFNLKAENLKNSFNKYFWHQDAKYPLLAVNDKGDTENVVTSNPGHLLFSGILDDVQVSAIVKRLTQVDIWTPYGIRTLSTHEKDFDEASYQQGSVWPFDNWVIYQGMLGSNYHAEAGKIKEGLLDAWRKLGRIPELYTVRKDSNNIERNKDACIIQAWSAGALINMLTSSESVL